MTEKGRLLTRYFVFLPQNMLISFEKVEYTTSILLKIFFSNKMSPKGLVPRLPSLENPFRPSAIPDVVGQVNQLINQNPATTAMAAAPGFVGQGNVNIDPVTRLTAAEEVLLDPLEKRYIKGQRTNTRLT